LRPVLTSVIARRCRDPSEVDDVVQEALLRAASYRAHRARPRRLRPWLVTVALRVHADRIRRRRTREQAELDYGAVLHGLLLERQQIPGHDREPPWRLGRHTLERQEALEEMRACLTELLDRDRAALSRYLGGADTCCEEPPAQDLGEGVRKVRMFRARRRLRLALRRRLALRCRRAPGPVVPTGEAAA
jgi:DNA-directed RNA polymerase specialized sigma24 family protein